MPQLKGSTRKSLVQSLKKDLHHSPEILYQHDVTYFLLHKRTKYRSAVERNRKTAIILDRPGLQVEEVHDLAGRKAEEPYLRYLRLRNEVDALAGQGPVSVVKAGFQRTHLGAAAYRHFPDSRPVFSRVIEHPAVQRLKSFEPPVLCYPDSLTSQCGHLPNLMGSATTRTEVNPLAIP